MTLKLRVENLSKYGKPTGQYQLYTLPESLELSNAVRNSLEIMAYSRCVIRVYDNEKEISSKQYTPSSTYQQMIYNQLCLSVWNKGAGRNNWKITKQYLDSIGVQYNYSLR